MVVILLMVCDVVFIRLVILNIVPLVLFQRNCGFNLYEEFGGSMSFLFEYCYGIDLDTCPSQSLENSKIRIRLSIFLLAII